ncbi:MAG: Na+/glucose cotransporter, partial [Prevotella sp.]|nr:Na+/glucose cotransporter [Prevotella sp.]
IGAGILYLWIIPGATEHIHFMMLSFCIFVVLVLAMVIVSLTDKEPTVNSQIVKMCEKPKRGVIIAWSLLAIVMISLYIFFNGH